MENFEIGKKTSIYSNNLFEMDIKRLPGAQIPKKFNAENYKFQVSLTTIHDKELVLNDTNIDYVRDAFLHIFGLIKKMYKKTTKTYIQLNVKFEELKKVYLKSGIMDLHDAHSKNIVYWIINQMNQIEQSSEDLVFSKKFSADFLIIKSTFPQGKFDIINNKGYRSTLSKTNYIICNRLKYGMFFNNLIKNGLVDLKLFFSDLFEEANCVFISVFFGIVYEENSFSLPQTLKQLKESFENSFKFQAEFEKVYEIPSTLYLQTKSITYIFDLISRKIKRDIIIFSTRQSIFMKVVHQTNHFPKRIPIKLLIKENHCVFIVDSINLQAKGKTFCDFCRTSFRNIRTHRCKRLKCPMCHLYTHRQFENEDICLTKCSNDGNFMCAKCNKITKNKECFNRHTKLSKTECSLLTRCLVCNVHYLKNNEHFCDQKFCQKCHSNHPKQIFCCIRKRKRKLLNKTFFLCDIRLENNIVQSTTICQYENNNEKVIFQFFKDNDYYFKYIFDFNSFQVIRREKIGYFGDLKFENILDELDVLNLKPQFMVDKDALEFLLDNLDLDNFKLSSKNNTVNKITSKFCSFSTYEDFLDFDMVHLLKMLNLPLSPLYSIKLFGLEKYNFHEKLKNINMEDFTKSYFNSNLSLYNFINKEQTTIEDIKVNTKEDFIKKSAFNAIIIYHTAFTKMDLFMKDIGIKMDEHLGIKANNFKGVLHFNSFSSASFSFFLSCMSKTKMPTFPSYEYNGNIFNSSKYEITFCKIFSEQHRSNFPSHKVKSFVDNDGEQFSLGRLSVDWFCADCKLAIFIEGNFKYICQKHSKLKNNSLNEKKRKILHDKGLIKRERFKSISQAYVNTIFVIGQCCISASNYPKEFKTSKFYFNGFGKRVLQELNNFNRKEFIRISFQNAMPPPFTLSLKDKFFTDGKSFATKIDINSAYLSSLTLESFKLPNTNIPEAFLVNKDADNFFHGLELSDDNFAIVKGIVIIDELEYLPYMPMRTKTNGIIYTYCGKCMTSIFEMSCSHKSKERGFVVEGYLNDFLFMKSIGYTIKCCQIIYFKSSHNYDLHYLAELLLDGRKNENDFIRNISKTFALIGIGRFALSVNKNVYKHVDTIKSNQEFCLQVEKGIVSNVDFYKDFALSFQKKRISNYENSVLSTRLNCSNIVFGMVASKIRREIYDFYKYIRTATNGKLDLLRIDTDSIIIECKNSADRELIKNYIEKSAFKYKTEMDKIHTVISFGRQSHFFENEDKRVLKVCGLRMSSFKRSNLKSFNNCSTNGYIDHI